MRVLQIGATGQIGYALTQALSRSPHDTTILIRKRGGLTFPANVRVIEASEFTPDVFRAAPHDMDSVIYGVGLPEQFSFDIEVFQRVNYGLFKSFLEALEASPLRRLLYISTYEVFEPIRGVIRESHPVADPVGMTPYFSSMTRAYRLVLDAAERMGLALTTIHPAAVYGGLNTGCGLTNFLENLLNWRVWRMPVILAGRFPVVHAESLAAAIVKALDVEGPFIVSDRITSLQEMARTLRQYARSYVPPVVPHAVAYSGATLMEGLGRMVGRQPILARVQVEFLTRGGEPSAEWAQAELEWRPLTLEEGIRTYLQARSSLQAKGSQATPP